MNNPAREIPGVKLSTRFDSLWCRLGQAKAGEDASGDARGSDAVLDAGALPTVELFDELARAYSEPQRHYHTMDHIEHCLNQLDSAAGVIGSPEAVDAIEMALWYHDIIYAPEAGDNEERSAKLFRERASGHIAEASIDSIYRLIMVTVHRESPLNMDERYMVDVDLSSFGMPWDDFYRDSIAVRNEMQHMSDSEFATGQGRFLSSLIERDHIYATEWFRDLYETRARRNIESYLTYLS